MKLSRIALAVVGASMFAAPVSAQKANLGTLEVSFASLGTRNCRSAISTKVTLKNTKSMPDKGSIVLNGGAPTAYDVPAGATATLAVDGGTLDCMKAVNLQAKITGTGLGGTTTFKTLAAESVTFFPKELTATMNRGTVRIGPTSPLKCGTLLELYGKYTDAPAGSHTDVTFTLGTAAPEVKTLNVGGSVRFTIASALDCSAPAPVFSFALGGNPPNSSYIQTVTYK